MDFTFTTPRGFHPDPLTASPFPAGTQLGLIYLAEGAANVIYKLHILDCLDSGLKTLNGKYILRLNKTARSSDASKQAVNDFATQILPLFPEGLLLEHILFQVPTESLARLNESLIRLETEGRRAKKRYGGYFPAVQSGEEIYGILMPDLSAQKPGQHLLEFKPKWLLQSPSAPANAKRCRTCALKDLRDEMKVAAGRADLGICPLDLLSSNDHTLISTVSKLGPDHHFSSAIFMEEFRLKVLPALLHLRQLQALRNGVGMHDFEKGSSDLSVAMALRDCSVLMQISTRTISEVSIDVVKFADLDPKTVDTEKLEYWTETERRLIDGGWYTGQAGGSPGLRCLLDNT